MIWACVPASWESRAASSARKGQSRAATTLMPSEAMTIICRATRFALAGSPMPRQLPTSTETLMLKAMPGRKSRASMRRPAVSPAKALMLSKGREATRTKSMR